MPSRFHHLSLLFTATTTLLAATLSPTCTYAEVAGNWPNWRGPNFDGTADASVKNLPVKFSPTENVLWTLPMPGPAASTPAVWGDHVFITNAVADEKKLYGMAIDRKTGKVLWNHAISEGYSTDEKSNLASPSPTTDGKLVFFFFGTGEVAAFDFAGKQVWKKNLEKEYGPLATQWTYSSSAMIGDGKLYFQVLQRNHSFDFAGKHKGVDGKPNDSYILALDPATGKEIWKVVRPSDAREESLEAFSSPVLASDGAKGKQILITGGDCITGHDPATGKELWRWGTYNPGKNPAYRTVPSAIAGDGIALVCAPKREPIFALPMAKKGSLDTKDIAWQTSQEAGSKDVSSDVSTPAYYKGNFYVVNSDRKKVSCVEAKTGKVVWENAVEAPDFKIQKFESSPTIADGKIYLVDHVGRVVVLATGDKYELLAINIMATEKEQDIRSSVVAAQGQVFVRTNHNLFCVGNK